MSEHTHNSGRKRVVCEMNASSASTEVVEAAISYCRERDAELVVVWVVDPIALRSPYAAGATVGTWGLSGTHGLMLDRLRRLGITADPVIRVGNASRVLEEERDRVGAERIFTSSDVPVRRCPACGAREDARAVHFCPTSHRGQRGPVEASRARNSRVTATA